MRVVVAEGAKLAVCFEGTNRIERMKLGGRSVFGIVDAKSHPDYIVGTGSFEVPAPGLCISIR